MSEFQGIDLTETRARAVRASILEARRQAVVIRLLGHRARTQTIIRFTGISRDRLAALRHRLGIRTEDRRRGPSPSSLIQIMRVPRLRTEGAALACMAISHGAFIVGRTTKSNFYSLATAERLCEVFELFRTCMISPSTSFDQCVLIAQSIAQGREISLAQCDRCEAVLLVDEFAGRLAPCPSCKSGPPQI